nr:bifunctional (p)ppGpp synthetase/guanosine-3',5'-bis(diphosphate) 3'-pyrophosphohydrolase [Bacteroidota bacterium]
MIEEKEEIAIEHKKYELLNACKNCSGENIGKLGSAMDFAAKVYGDKRKESGELQLCHSLSVAIIVASEIGLRTGSVVAAILHDIIDSPDQGVEEVEKRFGKDVATIIKGFKRISIIPVNKINLGSDNFRSLFLSMIEDVRIIFIKMAHRLYDMRIYEELPKSLQERYLSEVKYLYTPIAHQLGLYQVKGEFEDLSMKWSEPDRYKNIKSKLQETSQQQEKYIRKLISPIKQKLRDEGINCEIRSRTKSIPSISKKMEKQGVEFEQVYDLFAIRIIITDVLTDDELAYVEEFKNQTNIFDFHRPYKKGRKNKMIPTQAEKPVKKSKKQEMDTTSMSNEELQQILNQHEGNKRIYAQYINREKTSCWDVYSIITNIYMPNPKRLRDWISTPKHSGYESLHTTVLGPDQRWVEVQIRTKRMDMVAEKGDAAHWRYKETAYGKNIDQWMYDVRNVLETTGAQRLDDGQTSKIESKTNNIYVFTPEGDLRELKSGSTVLDFAFDIHTEVGSRCCGGKINGKVFPIRHPLKNGDRIEIITSKSQKPNLDWLNFVVTQKAIHRINRSLREEKYQEAETGKDILARKFKNWKLDLSEQTLGKIVKSYNFQKPVDLYYNIAIGKIDVLEIKHLFSRTEEIDDRAVDQNDDFELTEEHIESQSEKDSGFIMIEAGVSNLNFSLAKCCNPIAGDKIFGFVTVNQGIKIHRQNCPNAAQMKSRYDYRLMGARWRETENTKFFVTNLRIIGLDKVGLVNQITKVISDDLKVNMLKLNFKTRGSTFEGVIKIHVRNVEHLGFLKKKLLSIKGITRVVRYD